MRLSRTNLFFRCSLRTCFYTVGIARKSTLPLPLQSCGEVVTLIGLQARGPWHPSFVGPLLSKSISSSSNKKEESRIEFRGCFRIKTHTEEKQIPEFNPDSIPCVFSGNNTHGIYTGFNSGILFSLEK